MSNDMTVEPEVASLPDEDVTESGHSLRSKIVGIAAYVQALPRGDKAELRRLRQDSGRIPPEVFWRIVARYGIHESDELFWQSILPLMVKYPHTPGAKPGRRLDEAGVSPARVERWLRLDGRAALREADRFLSKLEAGVDWVQLGYLLYYWDDQRRRQLARDFYMTRSRRTEQSSEGGE